MEKRIKQIMEEVLKEQITDDFSKYIFEQIKQCKIS